MTTQEAQEVIATIAADFLANPYDLIRDIADNEEDNDEFQEALSVLGNDWSSQVSWEVSATCGNTTATA